MNYMNIAIKEAYKASKKGEVPVGAVVVKGNKILAKSHNTKENKGNAIDHAEIKVISKACKKLNTINLSKYIIMSNAWSCSMKLKE